VGQLVAATAAEVVHNAASTTQLRKKKGIAELACQEE